MTEILKFSDDSGLSTPIKETRTVVIKGRGLSSGYHKSGIYHHKYRVPVLPSNKPKSPAKPLKSLEGWILFVANLHEETSEDDINDAFREYGAVRNVSLNLDRRTGFVKGYALVEYENYVNAKSAREMLNNSDLLGVTIKVDWCFVNDVSNR